MCEDLHSYQKTLNLIKMSKYEMHLSEEWSFVELKTNNKFGKMIDENSFYSGILRPLEMMCEC